MDAEIILRKTDVCLELLQLILENPQSKTIGTAGNQNAAQYSKRTLENITLILHNQQDNNDSDFSLSIHYKYLTNPNPPLSYPPPSPQSHKSSPADCH